MIVENLTEPRLEAGSTHRFRRNVLGLAAITATVAAAAALAPETAFAAGAGLWTKNLDIWMSGLVVGGMFLGGIIGAIRGEWLYRHQPSSHPRSHVPAIDRHEYMENGLLVGIGAGFAVGGVASLALWLMQ